MIGFLELEQFINKNEDWIEKLKLAPYHLEVINQSKLDPTLFLLKYHQIDSDFSNPIVRECRGVIIRKEENKPCSIFCAPYTKFFNYNEQCADEIDWSSARVREKIDGWLIKGVVLDDKRIRFFTNGTFIEGEDLEKYKFSSGKSIRDVLWEAIKTDSPDAKLNDDPKSGVICEFSWISGNLKPGDTLMLEITSKETRIIVTPGKPKLWLHGYRDYTGQEHNPEEFKNIIPFEIPREYNFKNINEILEYIESWNGREHEGIVVCDKNFHRVKIKCSDYLRLKFITDYTELLKEEKYVWKFYMSGNADDIIGLDEKFKTIFDNFKNTLLDFNAVYLKAANLSRVYASEFNNYKDFALWVKNNVNPIIQPLFFRHSKVAKESDLKLLENTMNIWKEKKHIGYQLFKQTYDILKNEEIFRESQIL